MKELTKETLKKMSDDVGGETELIYFPNSSEFRSNFRKTYGFDIEEIYRERALMAKAAKLQREKGELI